jgi:hypothetical protein
MGTIVQQIITLRDRKKPDQIFTGEREAKKAAPILKGILGAQSSRIFEIVQHMDGSAESNTKKIHRWLKDGDADMALMRLYNDDTPYVIVDVTEVERLQAKSTQYVGVLKYGQTLGFDLLMLATPYRGRALPFHCISYSSRTIAEEKRSRNMEHRRAIADVMSKDRQYMEKLIMLVLIAYTIGVLVGEKIRDRMYRSEKKGTVILAFLF